MGFDEIVLAASMPVIPGITTSMRTSATPPRSTHRIASMPLDASTASYPENSSIRQKDRRMFLESSTTKILCLFELTAVSLISHMARM